MHAAAYEFVRQQATGDAVRVIEIGSRNINGTVRGLWPAAAYLGLDITAGPAVDVVADAATWLPEGLCDVVVCCEVLEHAAEWREILRNAARWLAPHGHMIVTCAAPNRAPHSAVDGGRVRPGEHYAGISAEGLRDELAGLFAAVSVQHVGEDVQAVSRNPLPQSR